MARAAKAKPNGRAGGFDQTFNAIDKVLRNEAGPTTELDYTEQTSWMLFLKYLDDLERQREDEAGLKGDAYQPIIDDEHRWGVWAAPKTANGAFDHDKALTGPDLIAYVNTELWPYLRGFRARAAGPDTVEYKIGEVFAEIQSKFQSGYSLRDALELIDGLSFGSQAEKHELSSLYEDKIKRMGNAGRNGGEYYTPRPLIRAMIQVMKPQIGERIYDGACGSAGFLCEAYQHMLPLAQTTADRETLQRNTFYGKEKKSLAYVIAIMNMILHGIDTPNILHTNTLSENVLDIQEKNRFDVILANPPFGGGERPEVQQNFPIRSGETAFLFLQHFMRSLRAGGRAAVVIKNTFLSNMDQAAMALRKELLETCDLHTVLDMPNGTFQGAGVKTVVLFFEKGRATQRTWFYQLDPGRSLGKTNALNDADMLDFVEKQSTFAIGPRSWLLNRADLSPASDLSVRNPSAKRREHLNADVSLREFSVIQRQWDETLASTILLRTSLSEMKVEWFETTVGKSSYHCLGKMLDKAKNKGTLRPYLRNVNVRWFEFDLSDLLEMRFTENDMPRYVIQKGDLVICEGGFPGRSAVWEEDEDMFFQKALHRVRFDNPAHAYVLNYYLYLLDISGELKTFFTGAGIQHFTGQSLATLPVRLPVDAHASDVAAKISDIMRNLRKLETLQSRRQEVLGTLKHSLIGQVFRGNGGQIAE